MLAPTTCSTHQSGPVEVSRAAHAFNNMQARLNRFIEERIRILAATSHGRLGLSIARNIARAHGGNVRLRDHENGGLEAILTLP
jgi:K+-sensing histidine kinase KdpD